MGGTPATPNGLQSAPDLLAQPRVHQIPTAVAYAKGAAWGASMSTWPVSEGGPWVVLARGLCGEAVARYPRPT